VVQPICSPLVQPSREQVTEQKLRCYGCHLRIKKQADKLLPPAHSRGQSLRM